MKGLQIFLILLIAGSIFAIEIPKNWIYKKSGGAILYSPDNEKRGDPYKAVELQAGIMTMDIEGIEKVAIYVRFILNAWDSTHKIESLEFDGGKNNVFAYLVTPDPMIPNGHLMLDKEFLANFLIDLTDQKTASLAVTAQGTYPYWTGKRWSQERFSRVILDSLTENDRKFLREIAETYLKIAK